MANASPILRYFTYAHLPEGLAAVSKPFHDLAHWIEDTVPAGAEKSTALRKLLESKDAAVRAALDAPGPPADETYTSLWAERQAMPVLDTTGQVTTLGEGAGRITYTVEGCTCAAGGIGLRHASHCDLWGRRTAWGSITRILDV